jgi:hypothetical protein
MSGHISVAVRKGDIVGANRKQITYRFIACALFQLSSVSAFFERFRDRGEGASTISSSSELPPSVARVFLDFLSTQRVS